MNVRIIISHYSRLARIIKYRITINKNGPKILKTTSSNFGPNLIFAKKVNRLFKSDVIFPTHSMASVRVLLNCYLVYLLFLGPAFMSGISHDFVFCTLCILNENCNLRNMIHALGSWKQLLAYYSFEQRKTVQPLHFARRDNGRCIFSNISLMYYPHGLKL